MQKTHYSKRPTTLEIGKYDLIYRYKIEEVTRDGGEETEPQTEYTAFEVTLKAPFSQNKLIETFFQKYFGNDFENKLINEYNSVVLGLVTDEEEKTAKTAKYAAFLKERAGIKSEIERLFSTAQQLGQI